MKLPSITCLGFLLLFFSCNNKEFEYEASGVFEAEETIVSAEVSGKIENFDLKEGVELMAGHYVGFIDTTQLYLKKLQLQAGIKTINSKKPNMPVQLSALKEQIAKAELERKRIQSLIKDGASTQKQLEDINSQITVLRNTLSAQSNTLSNSVNSISEEENMYAIQIAQVEDLLEKSYIVNPVSGTVLSKYSMENELVTIGKPLYKIANTKSLILKVYVIASQVNRLKVGQEATVYIHSENTDSHTYPATITWISDKAEFTPKTIQTKDERQNLVYAVKLDVNNSDGLLKIGMYADVKFK